MKILDLDFTYDQFQFRQLARENDVVLLEKSKLHFSQKTYEVIIIQRHPAQEIHGRSYPERESMPSSEAWGVSGWSLTALQAAQTKFRQVVKSRPNDLSSPTPFPAGASEAGERLNDAETHSGTSD